jgi:hypothetical protein
MLEISQSKDIFGETDVISDGKCENHEEENDQEDKE